MKRFNPVSSDNKIKKSKVWDREFHIHAMTYVALKNNGYEVFGEAVVRGINYGSQFDKNACCTFDLVVFLKDELLAIIEVKDSPNHNLEETRQGRRYRSFGVPVYLIWDEADIHRLLDALRAQKMRISAKKREKDYRSADWRSEQDRLRHFDYLTEGI